MKNEELKEEKQINNLKLDFPFYNDNPKIKAWEILMLIVPAILFTIYTFLPVKFLGSFGAYVFCGVQLIVFLIVSRGKISLIVKKPKIRDFVRIVVTLILQYLFVIIFNMILTFAFNAEFNSNSVLEMDMGVSFWIAIIVQLFGEELYKIMLFLGILVIMNKLTKKRMLSIVIATIITLVCFAILHATTYNNIVQILLFQGAATFFCMYNYLKTKNILTSYIQHFLLDAIPFILVMTNILPQ